MPSVDIDIEDYINDVECEECRASLDYKLDSHRYNSDQVIIKVERCGCEDENLEEEAYKEGYDEGYERGIEETKEEFPPNWKAIEKKLFLREYYE